MSASPRYHVYWEEQRVLELTAEPGPLISRAAPPPPPGEAIPEHPFVSGSSLTVAHEPRLRQILEAASSAADFVEKLRRHGYRVETIEP